MCNLKSPYDFNSIIELLDYFSEEKKCLQYLEQLRWEDGKPICPHCEYGDKIYRFSDGKRFKCASCKKQFTAKVGTVFQDSKVPMRKWYCAMFFLSSHKKGISSIQLAKDLNVNKDTAWFMAQRIREMMPQTDNLFCGVVQMDETFVGGKNKNRHADKKVKNSQGRSFKDKVPVMGMINDNGKLRCHVIADTTAEALQEQVFNNVEVGSIIVTDEWKGYNGLEHWFDRKVVDHGRHNYVNDCGWTTNSIEGVWAQLKRSLGGIYHRVSKKYLQRYVNETTFRFNTRLMKESERFHYLMKNVNSPLKYKKLVYGEV